MELAREEHALRKAGEGEANADGADKIQLYNEAGEPISIPLEDRQRRNVLPILSIRGIYAQRGMCGLMMDVAAMMCGERPPATAPTIEFI